MEKKNSDTCIFSVVFPANVNFFEDFFNSLVEQDDQDFQVCLINDGIENLDRYLKNFPQIRFEVHDYSNTPAKIREKGLELLRESGFQNIIFADSDDFLSKNRVRIAKELLVQNDLVVNDLVIVNSEGKTIEENYFSKRLANHQKISEDFIRDKNIFGLGNSAIKGRLLKPITIPENLIAVDWFIFTKLMDANTKAVFVNEAQSYYRQHFNNSIGFSEISKERLKKSFKIKLLHSEALSKQSPEHEQYYKLLLSTEEYIKDNFETYYNYIINLNLEHPLWWEEAKTIKELNL